PLERLQLVEDLGLDRHVQRGDRLVADHEVGLQSEARGDPDPLALAARELVRVAAGVVGREADRVLERLHLLAPLRRRPDLVDPETLADAVADRRSWVERRVRVLEDDLHPPPVRLELLAGQLRDVPALDEDLAGRRLDQAEQDATDRRLAATRLADQADGLAAVDREADAVDGLDRGDLAAQHPAVDREVLHEIPDLDERCRRRRPGGHGGRHGRDRGGGLLGHAPPSGVAPVPAWAIPAAAAPESATAPVA